MWPEWQAQLPDFCLMGLSGQSGRNELSPGRLIFPGRGRRGKHSRFIIKQLAVSNRQILTEQLSTEHSMRALITGITGQDGSYLAELLFQKGYEVFGLVRRNHPENYERIESILPRIELVKGDLTDQNSLENLVRELQPD